MRVFLETDRLILRRFTDADEDNLVELNSDPEVMRFLSGGRPTPRDVVRTRTIPVFLGYYERFEGFGFWAAVEIATGQFLGWFHFRPPLKDEDTPAGWDRRECGVVRHQPDLALGPAEGLDRRLPVDHGRHDVAVLGFFLLAHYHQVAVGDRGVDHGFSMDPEQEECPVADELPGQHEGVFDDLIGQVANTSGDLADQRDRNVGLALGRNVHLFRQAFYLEADSLPARQAHLDRARASRVTPQVPLALQDGELVGDARGTGEAAALPISRRVGAYLRRSANSVMTCRIFCCAQVST